MSTTTEQPGHAWQIERHLAYLAGPYGALPTVEQIAGPIVRGFADLQRLAEIAEALEFLAEFGPTPEQHRGEAFDVEAMFTRAAKVVVVAAVNHTAGVDSQRRVAMALTDVVETISGIRDLRVYVFGPFADQLAGLADGTVTR